jgi:hypothetical protein
MKRFSDYELLTSPRRRNSGAGDDIDGLGVFVPGLMGAGILLSAGILVSDGIKKLFPNSGARRSIDVTRGVQRIVGDAAAAAGVAIEERNISRRGLRSVALYTIGSLASALFAVTSVARGIKAYDTDGVLEENAIGIVFGSAIGAIAITFAVVLAILAVVRNKRIAGITTLMETTILGRLQAPPTSRLERARLIIPHLQQGDSP